MAENEQERIVIRGLKDVAAATTQTSHVDPNGFLYYAGYNIDDLVGKATYEEVVYLLLHHKLPTTKERDNITTELLSEMNLPHQIIDRMKDASPDCHPMEILRTEVSHLGEFDPERNDTSDDANMRRAIRLIAKVPTIIASLHRIRTKQKLVTPSEEFTFIQNFLYMFRGKIVDLEEKKAMQRFMILHADHGLNASTFAARVTASTGSDMYSAVTSAVGTLKGEFHGGASERVMKMLCDINNINEVETYIQSQLNDNKKIMGFGHRVYKAADPRTKHLREIAERMSHQRDTLEFYNKCKKIQDTVYEKKGIFPNVDFYAALVMHSLGVPREFYTPFFAASRVTGWTAHTLEQYADAVLIRPTSKYIGEYGKAFIPIENR